MKLPPDLFTVPFRMQPGLRRSAAGTPHFTPLLASEPVFHEKLAVLAQHAGQALLLQPGFDAQPALRRIAEVLVQEHPQHFHFDGETLYAQRLHAQVAIASGTLQFAAAADAAVKSALQALPAALAPWGVLALAVHEDLAVPCGPSGELQVLAVCLPSHWRPGDKIGRPFAQVHAPVADNALLLAAAQGLMQLVMRGDGAAPWERYVWTITPGAQYDAHPGRSAARRWPATDDVRAYAQQIFLRVERQSFIALPPDQAVFTIHVEMLPLLDALQAPGAAQALHDSLASMSPAVLHYRGFDGQRERLLAAVKCALYTDTPVTNS